MTSPSQQVVSHMKQLGEQAAASFYGKSASAIRTAINTKNISGKLIDRYFESLNGAEQPAEPTVTSATYSSDTGLNATEVHGKLNDLHGRLTENEQSMKDIHGKLDDLTTQIGELTAVTAARSLGGNSAIRPQGEAYGNQSSPAPARPEDAPPVVSSSARNTGMAPTMQEARRTNQGAKGLPAQPAQPRVLQPGEPGNWGWNDTKEQRKAKQELALERAKQQLQ